MKPRKERESQKKFSHPPSLYSEEILSLLLSILVSFGLLRPFLGSTRRYSPIVTFGPGFLLLPIDCSCGSTHSLSSRLQIFVPALRRLFCQVFPLVCCFNTSSCAQQGLLREISFRPSILALLGVTVYPILAAGVSCTQSS
jgi:hypothetical protein